jgi:hypothetical protein
LSIIGLALRIAYQLRRHFWLAWPVSRWLGLVVFVLALWAARRWWPNLVPAAAILSTWLAYLAFLALAARRRYVHFRPLPGAGGQLEKQERPAPLGKLELVPARATGWFTVEGQGQHYVDVDADFETTGTREHIVLARVHHSRFLFVASWPGHELGWWYIFVEPSTIRCLGLGELHFGLRPRLALRIDYMLKQEKKERVESVYMTFTDDASLRRVWEDLVRDAPPGAAA